MKMLKHKKHYYRKKIEVVGINKEKLASDIYVIRNSE